MSIQSDKNRGGARSAFDVAARAAWRMPGRFGVARILGPSYALRIVVFHNVSANESPFTDGMGVSSTPADFEAALKFLARHYNPIGLRDVLNNCNGRGLPPRPVLFTFDDGYASVLESAVPMCRKLGVPAVFFLNAASIDNHRLAPDNLVCYAANVVGMGIINAAARAVKGAEAPKMQSLAEVFASFFVAISLPEREAFLEALIHLGGIDECALAAEARLYMTGKQVSELASSDFEIGNHTYSHVRCRSLSARGFTEEIDRNKADLEAMSGANVRSFSLPYGSSGDLTEGLIDHLHHSGHEAVFLSESVANRSGAALFGLDRVSLRSDSEDGFFSEMEVLPRLRAIRNRFFRTLYGARRRQQTAAAH